MTTPSPKLGLAVPSTSDGFSTADLAANWNKIDSSPGSYICTSSTRPTWGAGQAGRKILETDTLLEWVWTGSAWKRLAPVGLLKRADGSFAIGEQTSDQSTTSNTFVKAVSVTNVVVPAGNRPIKVEVAWQRAKNSAGSFGGAVFRSNTNNSGPIMAQWSFGTSTNDANAGGGTYFAIERNGLAAGTYDFSLQFNGPTGTSILNASASTPLTILVTEL